MNNFKFGISIPDVTPNFNTLIKGINYKYFDGIELRGNIFKNSDLPNLLKLYRLRILNLFNLVEPSILSNIDTQPNNVRQELIKLLYSSISNYKEFNIQNFSLDFGLCNTAYKNKPNLVKIEFLRQLYYPIYKSKKHICMPLTIPDNNSENIKNLTDTLKELMLDNFRICINIFPHEIKKKISPDSLFENFIFDLQLIRIIYEPSTGNHLTEALLKFWLDPLIKINFKGSIIICPNVNNLESFEEEVNKTEIIIDKLIN
ncbi:MAG TPA: hypothetical protein QF753_04515 [Victivallales bacterium]|nr:hypothetical protein [Victivallales bacterium]